MRKVLLTLAMAGLVAGAVLAQRGGFMFGRGGLSGDALLGNKSVQDELKLTDAQKKEVDKAAKARDEAFRKAREDMDFEGIGKAMTAFTKALGEVRKTLTSTQAKRFTEIEVQVAVKNNQADIFNRPDIAKALSLTDKQKATIKDSITELEKDIKEVREELKGNFRELMPKIQKLSQGTFEKITKTFTDAQKKTLKEMQGTTFELKMDAFPGFGKGKGKKKDDF